MQATLRCCCIVLVVSLCSTSTHGHRDLKQLESSPTPANASSPIAPIAAPITSPATGSQTRSGPPAPPPPPPPPSPETFPSPPPPPPPPSPIKYWPAAPALASDSAQSGSGAPSEAPQGSAVMAPGPAPAVRVSISESVPTVSASVTLPSFTLQSFDTAAQAQFISMIEMAYPNNNISVKIDSINPGSVVVNTTATFLDGDQSAANSGAKALATAPATIFPTDQYGDVTTSDVSGGTVANPAVVPSETTEPTAQEASTSGAGAFAAISLSLVGAGCVFAFSL